MQIDDMRFGDVMRLAEMFRGGPTAVQVIDHGMAIVVLDRGFVYVGRTRTDGEWCVIEEARNIRRWGTTAGLGELVRTGPTSSTKLDPVGTVKAPMRAVISVLPTEEARWKKS